MGKRWLGDPGHYFHGSASIDQVTNCVHDVDVLQTKLQGKLARLAKHEQNTPLPLLITTQTST
eukprot:6262692-Amphidinium_carterae.1